MMPSNTAVPMGKPQQQHTMQMIDSINTFERCSQQLALPIPPVALYSVMAWPCGT
jgi:hypothetical protein